MNKNNNWDYLAVTIKSVFLALGFYFFFRIFRTNFYLGWIEPLKESNPPLWQILFYLGHSVFLVGLVLYFYFVKEDRHCLKAGRFGSKDVLYVLLGLLTGFLFNGGSILCAYLHGDMDMAFKGLNVKMFLFSFFAVALQSITEEIEYRLWIHNRIKKEATVFYAVIGSSIAFACAHMLNKGITFVAFINLILNGALCSLLLELTGSIWYSSGMHIGWNFTQNFIFGLPNSGNPAILSIMAPTYTQSSFFYDPVFGVEGAGNGMILNGIFLVILLILYKKKEKRNL